VKHIPDFPSPFSATNWLSLGELEVRTGSDVERIIQTWLIDILNPLELHVDLFNRVLRSASEAASRALQLNDVTMELGHIHVLAFAPHDYKSRGPTWGFFRLEKLEGNGQDQSLPHHSIELYLYIEGQPDSKHGAITKTPSNR
jgi:hypothetical protein